MESRSETDICKLLFASLTTTGSLIFDNACSSKHFDKMNNPVAPCWDPSTTSATKRFLFAIFLVFGILFIAGNTPAECVDGDCVNGAGKYIWPDGNEYLGEWENGKPNGKGIFIWPEGDTYVGEWNNDQNYGQGIYSCPTGAKIYSIDSTNGEIDEPGCIRGDCINGYGIFTWISGAKYVGAFEDGEQNGPGSYSFPNGRRIEGIWNNGRYVGQMRPQISNFEG